MRDLRSDDSGGHFAAFFRQIVLDSADAIIAIDQDHRVIFHNHAAEDLFGYSDSEFVGRPLNFLLPERFRAHHGAHLDAFLASKASAQYMGQRHSHVMGLRADGTEVPLGASVLTFDLAGEHIMVAILRDVSKRLQLQDELTRMASIDALTGDLNRRAFIEAAEKELRRANRYGTGISLLMFDLDHFKNINDQYGHDVGDKVICHFSELARSALRETDLFARWGGEEFIAALPNTPLHGAMQTAERIREKVANLPCQTVDGRRVPVTVSIGVSDNVTAPGKQAELADLLKSADDALYAAKKAGRNRVRADMGDDETA